MTTQPSEVQSERAVEPAAPSSMLSGKPAPRPKGGVRAWKLAGAGVAVVAVVAVVAALLLRADFKSKAAESRGQLPLFLKAEHVGRDVLISWDRSAVAQINALRANVTISDGDTRKAISLDSSELETGRILYTPTGGELAVRLDLHIADRTLSESIRILEQGSVAANTELPRAGAQTEPHPNPQTEPQPNPQTETHPNSQTEPQPAAVPHAAPGDGAPAKSAPAEARQAFVPPAARSHKNDMKVEEPPQISSRIDPSLATPLPNPQLAAPPPRLPDAPAGETSAKSSGNATTQPIPVHRVQPDLAAQVRPLLALLTSPVIVEIEVQLDSAGAVVKTRTIRVTAEPTASREGLRQRLILSALTAAKNWRFEPARRNGEPLPSKSVLTFRFAPPTRSR